MDFDAFSESLSGDAAPAEVEGALLALWWEAKGNWDKAHDLAQSVGSREGDGVHAYLHRKEGDEGNAGYWYGRAGRPLFKGSSEEEWAAMVRELL